MATDGRAYLPLSDETSGRDDQDQGFQVAQDGSASAETEKAAIPSVVTRDENNVVRLPEGVTIDEIRVDGPDLILVQADGSEIRVLGGALDLPTFIIGDIELPRQVLVAVLEGNGFEVAAGPDGSLSVQPAGQQNSGHDVQDIQLNNPDDAGPGFLDLLDNRATPNGATADKEEVIDGGIEQDDGGVEQDDGAPGSVNDAPVANADLVAASEDTAIIVPARGLLANDTDADNDTLVVSAINGNAAAVGVAQTLTSGALATVNADGSLSYNPNGQFEALGEGQSATDSFTYTVSDGNGGTSTATATVQITGVNDAPVLSLGAALPAQLQFSNATPAAINDVSTMTSTIVVSGADPFLLDLNLLTLIRHTFAADLDITLTSPSGTVVTITTDNGGGNDNVFNGTVWDDSANPLGQVPYTTNNGLVTDHLYQNNVTATDLVPEGAFGAFIGEDPNGTWTLTIVDDLGGDVGSLDGWTLDLQTLPTAPVTQNQTFANNSEAVIPSGPAIVTSTIVVSGAGDTLLDVDLRTFIAHTFGADLDITLTSPSGTVVTITTDNGGSDDNVFNGTLWDDNGAATVTDAVYVDGVPRPSLIPEEAMAAFVGENPNGTWTLTISDDTAADGGARNSWSLDLKSYNSNALPTFVENQAAVVIAPAATVSDVDSATLAGATVSITANFDAGGDVLNFTNQNGITGSFNATTGVLTLSGVASVANYQAALRSITFGSTSENPNPATRTISIQVDDGASANNLSAVQTVNVAVTAVNDAPVNTVPGGQTVNEDTALVFNGSNAISIADVDANPGDVTVTLTVANGGLTLAGIAGLNFSTGDGTADATMTFSGTVAAVNAALNGMSYLGGANFSGADTLSITTDDTGNSGTGGALTDNDSFAITVNAVNDAPVNAMPAAQTVDEDATLVLGGANAISIADVDAGAGNVTVTLTVANGRLTLAGTAGLAFSGGDGTSDATMTFSGTIAAINAALDGLSYIGDADFNGSDSIGILTDDTGNTGGGGAQTDSDAVAITVNAVNDAPVNTAPAVQSVGEDTDLVFSTGNGNAISISDVDAGPGNVTVTLTVASGVLTLAGTAGLAFTTGDGTTDATMTFSGSVADINAALNGLSYIGNANFNGADALSIITNDNGNTGSGGALSDSDAVAINVNAVNDAPVNAVPGTQTVDEDTALVFGGANAISISDADAGPGNVTVTLTVASGVLTLSGTAGLAFTTGDGTSDTAMTFSGTVADINAALNGLSYIGGLNFNGADSLTITTDDNGNTPAPAQQDTDVVAINVNALNDAPVLSTGVPPAPTLEQFSNATPAAINDVSTTTSTIVVSGADPYLLDLNLLTLIRHTFPNDLDITLTSPSGTVVTITTDNGGDRDDVFNGTMWNDSANPGGQVPYASNNGLATDHAYQNGVTATALVPEGAFGAFIGENPNGTWTLTIVDDFGTDVGTLDGWSLDLQTLPEAPVTQDQTFGNATPVAISTGTASVVTSTIVVSGAPDTLLDLDLRTFITHTAATDLDITLTSPSGTVVTLTTDNGGGNDNVFNGTLWDDNGAATATDNLYANNVLAPWLIPEEALAAFVGENPNGTWTLRISDDATTNGGSLNSWSLDFKSYASQPVFVEDEAAVAIAPAATVSDVDSATLAGATVSITGNFEPGADQLDFLDQNGITGSFNDMTGVLTLSGPASVADYQAALRSIAFRNTSENPNTATRTISMQVDDGASANNLSAVQTVTVAVTAVNDAPENTVPPAGQPVNEDTALVYNTANNNLITISDVDAGSGDVTVTLAVTSGTLSLGSTANLTAFTNNAASITLTGTVANINAALDGLAYTGNLNFNGSDALSITTDDNGNSPAPAQQDNDVSAINVMAVNDAPENAVPGAQTVDEDTDLIFSTGNGNAISISDVDAGASTVMVTLTVASGVLTLAGTAGLAFSAGDGTADNTMTFSGTVGDINAALNGLVYRGDLNASGGDALGITTDDIGNTGSGGPLTDTDSVAITVNAVNDAPVNSVPGTQTVNEDTDLTFSTGNGNAISISDVDAGTDSVTVTLTVASGVLTLAGTTGLAFATGDGTADTTMTFSGTLGDINTALNGLVYRGNLDASGGDALSITTDDNGNTGNGGAQTDTDAVAINVVAVNDGPVNTVPGAQAVDEDTALVLGGANAISIADVDAGTVTVTLTVGSGVLTLAGIAGLAFATGDGTADATMTFSGTVAAINTALDGLSYTGNANFNGTDSLSILTDDTGNTGSGGPLTDSDSVAITVDAVNDAPTLTAVDVDPSYQVAGVPLFQGTSVSTGAANESTQNIRELVLTVSNVEGTGADESLFIDGTAVTLTHNNSATGANNLVDILVTLSGGTATVTISKAGGIAAADVATIVDGLTYTNAAVGAGEVARDVTITSITDDGGTNPGADTSNPNITSTVNFNIAPTVTAGDTLNYVENDAATVIDPTIAISDPDDTNMEGATVRITSGFVSGEDELTFTPVGAINGSFVGDTLTLTGTGTIAEYEQVLESVRYRNTSNDPSDSVRMISYIVDDGAALSNTATATVNVVGQNDAPVNNGVPGTQQSAFSDIASTFTGLSISDADAGSGIVTTTLSATNGNITVNLGASGATISAGANNSHSVTLSGTVTQINAALGNNVTYQSDSGYTGQDSFTMLTNDGGNTPAPAATDSDSFNIAVLPQVWFIDNTPPASPSGPLGSQNNPFTSIDAFNDANGQPGGPGINDTVYLRAGTYSESDGINLLNGQTLIGQGENLEFTNPFNPGGPPIVLETGSMGQTPVIIVTGNNNEGISLAQNNTIRGLDIGMDANNGAVGIEDGGGTVGSLTISNVGIGVGFSNGAAVHIDQGGTLNVSLDSITSSNAVFAVNLGSIAGLSGTGAGFTVTGATVLNDVLNDGLLIQNSSLNATFGGKVTVLNDAPGANGGGVALSANTGTYSFNGGVDITVNGNNAFGFRALSSGTVNISDPGGNTTQITSNNGTALLINPTTLNATLDSITSGGGSEGISLTGMSGSLTIGTVSINGQSGDGIDITNSSGSVTISGGSIGNTNDPGGLGVDINGGTGAVSIAASVTKSGGGGNVIDVNDHETGNVTFSGNVSTSGGGGGITVANVNSGVVTFSGQNISITTTGTDRGVQLDNNASGTINFTPAAGGVGFDINTNSGRGFGATGGGTINVTGTDNDITTFSGQVITWQDVTIGASGANFDIIQEGLSPSSFTKFSFFNVDGGTFNANAASVGGATSAGADGISISGGSSTNFNFANFAASNIAGNAIEITGAGNGNVTFGNVLIDTVTGAALLVDSNTGSVAINGGTIIGGGNLGLLLGAIDINGGSGDITIGATITKTTAGETVEVTNRTGGTVDFNGLITSSTSAGGIDLDNNDQGVAGATGTVRFDGGINIATTGSNIAFSATNGGVVIVTDPTGATANVLSAPSATALRVTDTTIGAAGLTFQSISSGNTNAAADPVSGIILNNTGTVGGLTITGNANAMQGGDNSGGTIQNTTGAGISLTNTRDVSLTNVRVLDAGGDGILGTGVTNFTLANSRIEGAGDAVSEHGLDFGTGGVNNLLGTVTISGSVINNTHQHAVHVENVSGTLVMNVTRSAFTNNHATEGGAGILFEADGNANMTLRVNGGDGSVAQRNTFSNLNTDGILVNTEGTSGSTATLIAHHNTFDTIGGSSGVIAITGIGGSNNSGSFNIHHNTITNFEIEGITVAALDDSELTGVIADNTIVGDTTPGMIGTGRGIVIVADGGPSLLSPEIVVDVLRNNVSGIVDAPAVFVRARDGNGGFVDMIFEENTIATPINGGNLGSSGVSIGVEDGMNLNLDVRDRDNDNINNTSSGFDEVNTGNSGYRLVDNSAGTLRLVGFTTGGNVQAFFNGENNSGSVVVSGGAPVTGTARNYVNAPALMSAEGEGADGGASLTASALDAIVQGALHRWMAAGLSAEQLATLNGTIITIADLDDGMLGFVSGGQIVIDDDAAGHGWFVDLTPHDDSEFVSTNVPGELKASAGTAATGIDLLTTVMHEIGHALGLHHQDEGLMAEVLEAGTRLLPQPALSIEFDDILLGDVANNALTGGDGSEFLHGSDGNDVLAGGGGSDLLIGGAGADVFVFDASALAGVDAVDLIADYDAAQGDVIDLTGLLGQLVGGAYTDAGEVSLAASGGNTDIVVDTNGAEDGGGMVVATLTGLHQTVNILYDHNLAEAAAA